jgi:hypothetical protein
MQEEFPPVGWFLLAWLFMCPFACTMKLIFISKRVVKDG